MISLILARLLLPEQFGILAIVTVFIALSGIFVDSGFGYALIQRPDVTKEDQSSVFWFNLAMGAVAACAMCASAPWISAYFSAPVLRPLTYLLSVSLVLNGIASVPRAMLTRALAFKPLLKVGVLSTVVSGVTGVALAWSGYGVWSLAWQVVSASTVTALALLWLWPLRDLGGPRVASLKRLWSFGGYMLVASLLNSMYGAILNTLVAKRYSAQDLGFYSRAQGTQSLPITLVSTALERVMLPTFSQAAPDKLRLIRGARESLVGVMALNLPAMAGLAALSRPVIQVLFGEKWLPCVPLLQALCVAGAFWPLHVVNLQALLGLGRSDLFFRLEVIKTTIGIGTLMVASPFGLQAIAWSQVAAGAVFFFVNAFYSGRLLGYGIIDQIGDTWLLGGLAVAMGVGIYWIERSSEVGAACKLLLLVPSGAIMYLGACYLLNAGNSRQSFLQLVAMIRGLVAHNGTR